MSHRMILPAALILTLLALAVALLEPTSRSTQSPPKPTGLAAASLSTDGPPTCCTQ